MGLFTPRGIRKIAQIAAFAAILASACTSKSDKFVDLVQARDRPRAAQLVNDPAKKKEWQKALEILKDFKFQLYEFAYKRDVIAGALHGSSPVRMLTSLPGYLENFAKYNVKAKMMQDLQGLRALGLGTTADDLQKKVDNALDEMDTKFSRILDLSTKDWEGRLRRDRPGYEQVIKEETIKRLQATLRVAKSAGFPKTAATAANSLINLRAALAK